MQKHLPWLLTLLMLLAGCSAPPRPVRYVYPLPPDQPRIEWLGTYASQDDFPKSEAQVAFEKISGSPPLDFFAGPYGIAADDAGRVFVADLYNKNIFVYDFNKRRIDFLLKEPILDRPYYLAIDSQKQIYVADGGRKEVLVISPAGEQVGSYGRKGELTNPTYVEVDEKHGRVYVVDSRPGQINVYDLASRERLSAFGYGELMGAQGLAIAPNGDLYVADTLNACIKVFDAQGRFLRKIGERNDTEWGMETPKDLAFDSDGNLWLIDYRKPFIRIYTPEGFLLLTVGGPLTHKMGFGTPTSIYISPLDEVYVTDLMGKRFSHWRYLSKGALARHPLLEGEIPR